MNKRRLQQAAQPCNAKCNGECVTGEVQGGQKTQICKPTAYHMELTGPKYARVRVLTLNKSPWFVLDDVLKASGASIKDLEPFPDFGRETILLPGSNGNERVSIVDESAFIWLATRGWKRKANTAEYRFSDWVGAVLIPHMRKNGRYILPAAEAHHE